MSCSAHLNHLFGYNLPIRLRHTATIPSSHSRFNLLDRHFDLFITNLPVRPNEIFRAVEPVRRKPILDDAGVERNTMRGLQGVSRRRRAAAHTANFWLRARAFGRVPNRQPPIIDCMFGVGQEFAPLETSSAVAPVANFCHRQTLVVCLNRIGMGPGIGRFGFRQLGQRRRKLPVAAPSLALGEPSRGLDVVAR